MNARLLIFFFLLIGFNGFAQDTDTTEEEPLDTFDFNLKIFKAKGPYDFVKVKSKSTGSTYQLTLAQGEWLYTDDKDVLRIKANYKVKGDQSIRWGTWEYYDTEGELLMIEEYPLGKKPVVYLKPFVLRREAGFDVIKTNDNNEWEVKEFRPPAPDPSTAGGGFNMAQDSFGTHVLDTFIAMDSRHTDTWLIDDSDTKKIKDKENLVKNSSFEKTDGKIKLGGSIDNLLDWSASAGTPDYYKSANFNAYDGDAAVGCRFYTEGMGHIEFISTELKEPLEANKTYCFKVFVRLSSESFFGVNALGVLFSEEIPPALDLINGVAKPSIKHNGGSPLLYKTKWMQLTCNYTANGTEEFMTLGSFANADSMDVVSQKGNKWEAYYFFDNVQLYEMNDSDLCPCTVGKFIPVEKPAPKLEPGKSFIIKNIFFDNDKWDLLPTSFKSLDSLFNILVKGDFKKIEISGHTSSTGSKERNILLSQKRAEAVKTYFVKRGLDEDLFICKGFGPNQPIADNSTEAGQAENRRVEFKILE